MLREKHQIKKFLIFKLNKISNFLRMIDLTEKTLYENYNK